MSAYIFGVDLGGTTVKIGLFEKLENEKKLLEKWEILTVTANGGAGILPDIANSITEKMEKKQIAKNDVLGIGICVPGAVLRGGIVNRCVNLGWGVKNVKDELEQLTGIHTKVGNDATIAALGELSAGAAAGYESMVMVTLGTGVGGGVIEEGKPVYGYFGAGGEIGHITVNPKEKATCGCGRKGCLEQYASATGIRRHFLRKLDAKKGKVDNYDPREYDFLYLHSDEEQKKIFAEHSVLEDMDDVQVKDIFAAALNGDAFAMAHVEEALNTLAYGCSLISVVIDPEVYVIGGGVSRAGQIVTDLTQKYFEKYAFHASKKAEFVIAQLGNDAGIWGAVNLIK